MTSKWILWAALIVALMGFLAVSFSDNLLGGVKVGDAVPNYELVALDGTHHTLDEWRGRPLILRFSSATCTYCSRDFELLDRLQEQLGENGRVVAVQVADTPASVRSALMGASPQAPVVIDRAAELTQALGVRSLPAVAFITARGTLSSLVNSEIADVHVAQHLQTALRGGPNFQRDLQKAAQQLRCQECDGRSVWESDSRSSIEIREEIQRRLLAGERPEEVVERFREVYGDWILMAPPVEGIAALAWFLPAGGLVFGVGAWFVYLRRRTKKRAATEAGEADAEGDRNESLKARIKEYM